MNIYVFGNPDLVSDALPIRMLPRLRAELPHIDFIVQDPHELGLPDEQFYWVLDTVRGISKVRVIHIQEIKKHRARTTMHDFDLATHLLLVAKLKPITDIRIIGVPEKGNAGTILKEIVSLLSSALQENAPHSSYTDRTRE